MMDEIGCKKCGSPDCRGCNMFILSKALRSGVFTTVMNKTMSIDIDALKEKLAERKAGKWMPPKKHGCWSYDERAYCSCSICGTAQFLAKSMKFCPNCGAKMEVDE